MTRSLIASKLREYRGDTPRAEVAAAVGISLSALQMYENGERLPRDQVKKALADFYHTTVGELFFDE